MAQPPPGPAEPSKQGHQECGKDRAQLISLWSVLSHDPCGHVFVNGHFILLYTPSPLPQPGCPSADMSLVFQLKGWVSWQGDFLRVSMKHPKVVWDVTDALYRIWWLKYGCCSPASQMLQDWNGHKWWQNFEIWFGDSLFQTCLENNSSWQHRLWSLLDWHRHLFSQPRLFSGLLTLNICWLRLRRIVWYCA